MHVVDQIGESLSLCIRLSTFIGKEHCCGTMKSRTEDCHVESPVEVVLVWIHHPRASVMFDRKD